MSPASMKTHHGGERFRSTSVGAGRNGGAGGRREASADRDRRHASSSSARYRHDKYEFSPTSGARQHFRGRRPQHHRKYGLAGLEDSGGGDEDDDWRASVGRRLTVPAPLHLQSSEVRD